MTNVSVIVPSHNGKKHMKNCLETWLNQDFPKKDFEIIIIDNESSDGGYKIVQQYQKRHKNIRLVRNKIGRGYSGGGNQGVELAKGRYIIISNDDIFVEKNWIKLALQDLQEPNVGATHGLIYFYKTKKFWYSGAKCYPFGFANHNAIGLKEGYADYLQGAVFMLSKKVINEIGGLFDDVYFGYDEDRELGLRLRKYGYKIKYNPNLVSHHNISLSRLNSYEVYQSFKNRTYTEYKYSNFPGSIALILDILIGFNAHLIYNLIRKPQTAKFLSEIARARIDSLKMVFPELKKTNIRGEINSA